MIIHYHSTPNSYRCNKTGERLWYHYYTHIERNFKPFQYTGCYWTALVALVRIQYRWNRYPGSRSVIWMIRGTSPDPGDLEWRVYLASPRDSNETGGEHDPRPLKGVVGGWELLVWTMPQYKSYRFLSQFRRSVAAIIRWCHRSHFWADESLIMCTESVRFTLALEYVGVDVFVH